MGNYFCLFGTYLDVRAGIPNVCYVFMLDKGNILT